MKTALGTNITGCAAEIADQTSLGAAREVVHPLPLANTFVALQALGKLFLVLTRKGRWSGQVAGAGVVGWRDAFASIQTTHEILLSALELAVDHQLRIWDAIVLSAAAEAGCRLALSEDLHDGFIGRGVTVINSFTAMRHPTLAVAFAKS